jgi:hypothetical protein
MRRLLVIDVSGHVDLCELLTAAEIEGAVGNPVEDGVPEVGNACGWDSDADTSVSVHLLVGPTQRSTDCDMTRAETTREDS